ncbi:VOC family protein [Blastococcus sp. TBT05-19]|uniref:bleomycin resistance protein n=1 Tax=Blastococcus sp. TBT05-19 TaxID=2250581 RepID=UPI00131412A6|nr:VOC family protein [Blastococcus sp. TBT05-19]
MAHEHPRVRISPIFRTTDLQRALDHYAALGCAVSRHDDGYGFAARAGVEIHLELVEHMDPALSPGGAYLHVPDADALFAEWAAIDRTGAPVDTDYGLREGWHIDPDGNLLRFGSPLPSGA